MTNTSIASHLLLCAVAALPPSVILPFRQPNCECHTIIYHAMLPKVSARLLPRGLALMSRVGGVGESASVDLDATAISYIQEQGTSAYRLWSGRREC